MSEDFVSLLSKLVEQPAISGHEDLMSRFFSDQLKPYAQNVKIDAAGNVIAQIGSGTPRVAILAHIDTIGFLVKCANNDGTLRVVSVGGVNLKALPGTAVRVGDMEGMFGVRSQHLARSGDGAVNSIEDVFVDVGGAEVEPTTPITYMPQMLRLGEKLVSSPYLDNRSGCAVVLKLAQALATTSTSIYVIGTVQEETTCVGVFYALQNIAPEAAIFVDGTVSYDTPDTRGRGDVRLGGGPVLTSFLYTSGLNGWHANPKLRAHLKQVALEESIPFQQDAVHGLMSDARVSGWLGTPSAIVGLPMRNKHAPLETVHLDDLDYAVRLLSAALRRPLPDLSRG